ncbi:class I SAM-dependent methyltransferase [Paradesertivirga mongoliensis]|uniref:Class I SAM-dependent methyltransferase n=1 Tax=Paradesertivirga mongoliensis TaxID=2100740 RepID=A0ABW4ZIG8_9SPHI|nr:class I SAM-dependent methyltransferase [Pedobacter mongoliensis]
MAVISPLTQKDNTELIEEIKTSDLVRLYKKLGFSELKELKPHETIGLYRCLDTDLRFFFPQATGEAEFYETLQTYDWYYLEGKSEYLYAESLINKGDKVLDVGCGRGQFGSQLSSKADFTGLEFNGEAIKKAQIAGLNVIKQSIEEHAVENEGRYDVVTSFQVLEHIGNSRDFIRASLSAVKPGGKLVVSVPSYDSLVSVQLNNTLNLPPHHMSWWSDTALESLADLFNMELIAIHHEELDTAHKQWYSFLLIAEVLKKMLGFKSSRKVIDTSLSLKLIHGVAKVLSPLLAKGLIDKRMTPYGHSVTAVYRKK